MRQRIRSHLTYANVVATLALFLVLGGGTAMAAFVVSSNSQIGPGTVSGHSPPSGKHSNLIAGSVNRTDLSAATKTSFALRCPAGMLRAGDLCFETQLRRDNWPTAIQTCAAAGRHLPDADELALVFDHLGAPQGDEWVSNWWNDANGNQISQVAGLVSENDSRQLSYGGGIRDIVDNRIDYRCVSSPSN